MALVKFYQATDSALSSQAIHNGNFYLVPSDEDNTGHLYVDLNNTRYDVAPYHQEVLVSNDEPTAIGCKLWIEV